MGPLSPSQGRPNRCEAEGGSAAGHGAPNFSPDNGRELGQAAWLPRPGASAGRVTVMGQQWDTCVVTARANPGPGHAHTLSTKSFSGTSIVSCWAPKRLR